MSDIVFIGKSLVPLGGQNPLEALKLECAVLHGPHMTNFEKIVTEMSESNCSITVKNAESLFQEIDHLISNKERRSMMISNGNTYLRSRSRVIEKVTNEILLVQNETEKLVETDAAT